jgi:hypothetical protein
VRSSPRLQLAQFNDVGRSGVTDAKLPAQRRDVGKKTEAAGKDFSEWQGICC